MDDINKKRAFSRRQFLRLSAITATGIIAAACGGASGGAGPTATTVAGPTATTAAGGAAAPTATTAAGGAATATGAAPSAATATGAATSAATATGAAGAAAATATTGGPTPVPTVAVSTFGQSSAPTVIWGGLTGADGATFGSLLKNYTDQNSGKAVRAEMYVWDVMYQKFPTAVAAGTPPDVSIFHSTELPQYYTQGLFQPLDDIMYNGIIPADDYKPFVIDAVTIDGKKVGVPFDNHGWVNYINTKIIKDAGLDPNNLPKNGADFVTFANKITTDESGKHPGDSGFNSDKVKIWAFHNTWIRFSMPSTYYQFGGGIITPDRKKSLLDSAETTAAVQYWYDMMYKYKNTPPAVPGATGDYDLYKSGSLAVRWEGSWTLGFFNDNPDLVPNTQAVWLNSLAPDGKQVAKIDLHNFQIPAGVNQDGVKRAQDLIKWLSENSDQWAKSGQVPARLSRQAKSNVQSNWETKNAADEFSHIGHPDVTHKAFTEIQAAWEAAVGAALANTTPVKDALAQGSQQIQSILDRG